MNRYKFVIHKTPKERFEEESKKLEEKRKKSTEEKASYQKRLLSFFVGQAYENLMSKHGLEDI